MAIDVNVQPYISTFIQSQFPRLYEQYGQPFIDFVTAYYVWLETEGPLYDSRRASSYQDIDTTVAKFIVFFKDKYLPNIQLETVSNVDLLVKHSLDVYRSRGTIRSIDLLFRLVFGFGADVYYPFDDVFQPSSGEWIIPLYLEVSTREDLQKFVGKEITGVNSGARAFVESWVRKKAGAKQIDCLYISALEGNFQTGERINAVKSPFPILAVPTIIGSLTSVAILGGGLGYNVGDIVNVVGTNGYGGKARIANTQSATGVVNFQLQDGGYGYTANSQVLVSQSVFSLVTVLPGANTVDGDFFQTFETISQPTANINYQSSVGGFFVNNDIITNYAANGSVLGTGVVLSAANGTSANGALVVSILSGNLQSNAIYNAGNVVSANVPVIAGYTSTTASANVIAETATFTANLTSVTGTFQLNETIQINASSTARLTSIVPGGPVVPIAVDTRTGIWPANSTILGLTSGATATISSIAMSVGVISINNTFFNDTRAIVTTPVSGTTGFINAISLGTLASYAVSPNLLYPETILLNTDFIFPFNGVALSASTWPGFTAFPTANLATPIATALRVSSFTVGRVASLIGTSPGSGYNIPPLTRIFEPLSFWQQKRKNKTLNYTGATGTFAIGDLVTQTTSNARGLVLQANTTALIVAKLSLFNVFTPGLVITSTSTGTTATVSTVDDPGYIDVENIGQTYLGLNAAVSANTLAGNGSVTAIQITSSGWGYENGDTLTFPNASGQFNATGQAQLVTQGFGKGFYRTENGFVSDIKKVQDSDYYQVSSYEVRASVAFDRYVDMLKALLHVAGTKPFGAFVHKQIGTAHVNIRSAVVSQPAIYVPQLDFSVALNSEFVPLIGI